LADLCQPIQTIIFVVSADLDQPIQKMTRV
jgi:hypothetical protein